MTQNVTWHSGDVNKEDKARLLGYHNKLLWFTGLSGSGKSTIARLLEQSLYEKGILSYVLDGDNVRHGLNSDLGFSPEEREENIRRIGEVSNLFYDSGIYTIVSFISPYRKDRNRVRNMVGKDFVEIYVSCSVDECEKRDPKGLYKKARAGDIKDFTGVTAPYERPDNPELVLDTTLDSPEACVDKIIAYLGLEDFEAGMEEAEDISAGKRKVDDLELDLTKELETAKRLALEAGNKILDIYESDDFGVETKDDDSPLTKADLASEEVIKQGLQENFPDYGLLSEEAEDDAVRLSKDLVWIVDPLDGTKEFISRKGEFTVNIALTYRNEVVMGVVYIPAKRELFFAAQGKGAFFSKDGSEPVKIFASDKNETKDMILVRSRSHASDKLLKLIEDNDFKDIITSGSSLKGCVVAHGKADVYYRLGPTREWDVCAMNAIIKESGAKMTNLEGKPIKYNNKDTLMDGFLVSNGKIHEHLLNLLKET